jgi:hypothetical protein
MGCDSSKHFDDVYKNDSISEEGDENKNNNKKKEERNEELSGKEGNKANKDNRKNKKDQRKKRDMKNQQEFKLSDNDESISNSDSSKPKKALKKKLKSNTKKREESEGSEEEEINNNNREDNSNINTEGMATVETRKFNVKKNENEGLLIMDGIEDLFSEDLTEEDIYQLVEDALGDSIVENEENKVQGTITRTQARSVAKILYKKLKKKKGKYDIDISEYPELKGVNIKIGAGQLTKDVIKNMMFNENDIDENQIEKTYKKLTKNANDIKALTIELITEETDNK